MLLLEVSSMSSSKDSGSKLPQLGPLEMHLLALLCQRKDATVRELLVSGKIEAAYTTVMTTLDRLYKKGFLHRATDAQGQAFRYRLKQDDRMFYRATLGANLNRLLQLAADPSLPLSYLVETVTEHDSALLDELRRAVNRKRQELRRGRKP
jgi:predicted transcriptional regulator